MKNAYEIRGEITAIYLKSKKHGDMVTLISTRNLTKVMELSGRYYPVLVTDLKTFYVQGKTPKERKNIYLHRLITEAPGGLYVDHINHDTLDNTDNNLRLCTNSENQQNQLKANSASKSGILGVHWSKKDKKWKSQINVNGKIVFLGGFKDIYVAERVVKEARKKYLPFSQEAMGL